MHRVSNKAIFSAGADRAAQESWQASPTAEARSNAPVSGHAPGGSGVPPRIALVSKFNRAKGEMRRPPFQFAVAA